MDQEVQMLLEVQKVKKAKKDRKLQKGSQMAFLVQMANTERLLKVRIAS